MQVHADIGGVPYGNGFLVGSHSSMHFWGVREKGNTSRDISLCLNIMTMKNIALRCMYMM